jgi:VWFA-related protein
MTLAICGGQADTSGEASRAMPTISADADLVVIPVTVTNGKGQVVSGLEKQHFKIYEDKVEQVITHFASEDAPVSIGLLFDISGSMSPKMGKAREAVTELLRTANPADEFFLVEFNHEAAVTVGVTRQKDEITRRLRSMEVSGRTALLDALFLGLQEMKKAHNSRKAMVVISDGEDNSSRSTVREVNEAVGGTDVLIYSIGIVDPPPFSNSLPLRPVGSTLLSDISKQTGGRLFEVSKLKQLPDIAVKIGAWLRSQYVLGYPPANPEKDGRYHKVEVKLTKPKGMSRLHASWRLGYYAPAQ